MVIDYELGERIKLTDCPNRQIANYAVIDPMYIKVASDECRKCKHFNYFIKDNQVSCNFK